MGTLGDRLTQPELSDLKGSYPQDGSNSPQHYASGNRHGSTYRAAGLSKSLIIQVRQDLGHNS